MGEEILLNTYMRSLHNEDIELQIKLAKLRSDLHISATACVSFLGLIGIFMITLEQAFLAVPENQTILKYSFLIAFVAMAILFVLIGRFYIKKMLKNRKEIAELKEKYVW